MACTVKGFTIINYDSLQFAVHLTIVIYAPSYGQVSWYHNFIVLGNVIMIINYDSIVITIINYDRKVFII